MLHFPAQFLDVKTLAYALTNEGHSLESACKAFGVAHGKDKAREHGKITPEYIDYNRRDVLATAELLEKLRAEYLRHPIERFPAKALSPASIAKSYFNGMGIRSPREQFSELPTDVLATAFLSYYGGRAECRIRGVPVPVVYTDFLSMYPTVNTLMGLWELLTAERIEIKDVTAEVRRDLQSSQPGDFFRPDTWKGFNFFAQIIPNGDILPIRAKYGLANPGYNIGVNYVNSEIPLWYSGPDLFASKILSDKSPIVIKAFRLVPHGRQGDLRKTKLRGFVAIDPLSDDFFKVLIEQRKSLQKNIDLSDVERKRLDKFLKVEANAGSYGIFAELNPDDLPVKESVNLTVYGLRGPFTAKSRKPEDPGEFCFPPIAALITGGARLMLALLERSVIEAGGTYAFCDTDSLAIVASKNGGFVDCPNGKNGSIKALSWGMVQQIVEKFSRLNPYSRSIVRGSILKIEEVNFEGVRQRQIYAYVISAKRYALFTIKPDGSIDILDDPSQHGLGHLLNPTDPEDESRDWIRQLWEFIVRKAVGHSPKPPAWLNRPAISRITASTPEIVTRLNQTRRRLTYAQQIKPMNFGLAAHVVSSGLPQNVDPEHFQLIAPYESDPRKWTNMAWVDRHTGKRFGITTAPSTQPDVVQVKSYADVLTEYEAHPESKSVGLGDPNPRKARGLLARRHVRILPGNICYIGKESNRLEKVESELEHSLEDVLEVYKEPGLKGLDLALLDALKKIPSRELARVAGLSERSIRSIRNGHSNPRPDKLNALRLAAKAFPHKESK